MQALSHDLVSSQPGQAGNVGVPGGDGTGGDAPIVVQIYALGCGVAVKGQGGDLASAEGTFELEANGKVFVFDPLGARKAYGLVKPVKRNVTSIFLALQGVDEVGGSEIGNGFLQSGSPLKTTILYLPPGYGKTTMAQRLAARLGCTQIVDMWWHKLPITPGALHLTNALPAEIAAP